MRVHFARDMDVAVSVPEAELAIIDSPDGHDGFLLEFEQINQRVLLFLRRELGDFYASDGEEVVPVGFDIQKTSVFGEAEAGVDVTMW